MADRFTSEQVTEIADVLSTCCSVGAVDVLTALQDKGVSAFSESEIDSMRSAVNLLGRDLKDRPSWSVAPSRGLFFVFEGLDRSGKSTQSKQLQQSLLKHGKTVKWMCFPNRATPIGALIDLYLRKQVDMSDEAIHQLFSANRWESVPSLIEELNRGTTVVCDRYAFSGVAYSASKGLDFSWCQAPDRGLPVPDGVFYLHVDEKVGQSRANFGDERYENAEMQARVRQEFNRPALRESVVWHDVDGARPIEEVHAEVVAAERAIAQDMQENAIRPLQSLWLV